MPSQIEQIEKHLPFLPGFTIQKAKPQYRKSHRLDFKDGVRVVLDGDSETTIASSDRKEKAAKTNWMLKDKQVLRFYGSFYDENLKVNRLVTILFYLQDQTIQIHEDKIENCGWPQGTLLHRGLVTKSGLAEVEEHLSQDATEEETEAFMKEMYLGLDDFNVGKRVFIYGHRYELNACDQFTRNYLKNLGKEVPENRPQPQGYQAPKRPKVIISERISEPHRLHKSNQKFLLNDGQVLRFFCLWDDQKSQYGQRHYLVLHYFLCDDTMEIREYTSLKRKDDYDSGMRGEKYLHLPTAPFLKRHKIPKNRVEMKVDGSHLSNSGQNYFADSDLKVGKLIQVYGRNIFLFDCDSFTEHYLMKQNKQVEAVDPELIQSIDSESGEIIWKQKLASEFESISENDYEVPSVLPGAYELPKHKRGVDDRATLQFHAYWKTKDFLDSERRFVIEYHPFDDSFAIFEQPLKNSGIQGGKFLERSFIRKPNSRFFYTSDDLALNTELVFHGRTFVLTGMSEFSKVFILKHAHLFPKLKIEN